MQPVVNAGAFQHHDKAFVAALAGEELQAAGYAVPIKVSAFQRDGQVIRRENTHDGQLRLHQFLLRERQVIAGRRHLIHDIAAVGALDRGKPVRAAAGQIINPAVQVVRNEVFLVVAVLVVAGKVTGGGIGPMAGDGNAGLLPQLPGFYQDGGEVRFVRSHAYMAVGRFLAGRNGGAPCPGVRNQVVRAPGAGKAYVRELVKVEFAMVQHPGAAHLLQAHAIANHNDDVAHLIGLRGFLHLHNVIRMGRLVILEGRLLLFAGDHEHKAQEEGRCLFHIAKVSGIQSFVPLQGGRIQWQGGRLRWLCRRWSPTADHRASAPAG